MATYQWYADLRGPELQWADMVAVDTYAAAIEKVNNKPDGVHFGWATLRMVDDDGAIYDATIGDYPEGLLPTHLEWTRRIRWSLSSFTTRSVADHVYICLDT